MDFEYLKPIVADGFGDGDGEYTSAERRAEVLTQFRDKYGRWVEMGRGIKGKVRLGRSRGSDAGRTARIIGKFINATPDGKYARVLVDPSDPYFGGKVAYIKYDNAEEVLATLDPEYLKKRGIELGKHAEGYEVGDGGIQDEDTLRIEDPTPQDLKDAEADLPDPGDYREEAAKRTATALTGKDLAVGNIVYDQGADQYGKITQVRTLADGTKQIFIQFQNGRRAIMNIAADHPIQAWLGEEEAKPTPEVAPSQSREGSSIADLGIDLQPATMDANGARLPTPGAFTGAFQRILNKAKDWADIFKRLWNQTVTYFDLETTGISNYDGDGIKNSPIQLGAVKVKNGKIIGRFNVYINPGSKLSEWSADNLKRDVVDENGNVVLDENGNPQSTLVTPEWLAEQMSPTEAIKLFLEFIGPNALLGGQNVPFDLEILQRMADDAGIELKIAGTIDSKDLASLLPTYDPEKGIDGPKQIADKETGRMRPSSSLGPVANFLGFEPANWHSADGDAEDSYNLVREIIARAARENNLDMRLLDFPEMQRLYKERMAAFKNSISSNNPATEAQLNALNELADSDNQEIATEARKAIDEATTRGKAAEVLARLNNAKDRPNNTPNQFRIGGGGGGGELGEGNGVPNKKELEFLAKLKSGGYFLKKKFTKKPKQYIPVGYTRIDAWENYAPWYKDIFESAGSLDDFVKLFWKALRESQKGTRLEDKEGRTDINETEYAIAAAAYKNMQGIGEKVILRYGEFTIEFDKQSDINGQLLDELKDYLRTARQLGLKLPVRIKIAKQGDPAFTEGEVIGFDKDHPELGCLTGEAHTEPDGTMHLILWDQLHNLDKADKRRLFKGIDENGEEEYYGQNPGGFVPALQHVFFHELGHLWNREKHGKMVNSPLWGDLKKMFWGTDAKPFKRFSVSPNADKDFDERMAELFAAAIIALHNKEENVLPNIGQFWKVAIEPYIDAEPLHWTANSERVNPPKKEEKGKGKKTTTPRGGKARTPDVKKPEDVKPGDIVYDKDGNLHGKVGVIRQDRHGNWHYWVEGKDYKPGDVFPVGLDEYIVHKNGVIYLTKAGANFVPDEGPDFIYPLPEKLDSSNSDGVKAEDLKPGMVYQSPDGPANVVNVIEHGIGVPDVKKSSDRVVVYVGKDGEVKHEVVPVGTFKKVLISSKSNVPAPAPAPAPENENQGGEGNGNGSDRGGEGSGGGRGGRGGNAPEPVSEEPEVKPEAAPETESKPEPEVTREDPIGKGKIDPKGYAEKGYVPMVHPKPEFPAEIDEKKLIEKGFEIEEQDNRDKPSQNREEDGEEGEEGALPPEDTSGFGSGKKVVILWHNKDFSAPGARIKITFTRKADGSLDKRFTQIQWKHWDGTLSGDEYGPSEVLNIGDSESEIFRMEFKHTVGILARRNEEYNDGELPGTVPHFFRKVGDDYIWRAVKDPKTGKWKAARDQKIDLVKKPPFGAIISNKDGKWTATILDPKGNTVATFEVDGDENDKSALENLINQSYVELAKRYRSINAPTTAPSPANKPEKIDDSFVDLQDVAADWEKDKYGQIALGWNMARPRNGSGNMAAPKKGAEFWGEIRYWGSTDYPRDHISVKFQDKDGYWRGADLYGYYKDPELIAKAKQWLAQQYQIWKDPARRDATEGVTADGHKPKRGDTIYLVNRGKVEKITLDVGLEGDMDPEFKDLVGKYFVKQTNWGEYEIMLGSSERSAAHIGDMIDAYKDENLAKEELQRRLDNEKELENKYGFKFFKLNDEDEKEQLAEEEATPTTSPAELVGEHNHPLPEDVQMLPAGVGELYAKYVINGEGFQHESDYPDVRVKDGLRYGVEIYYEEAIEPNSYNKKGRVAGWRISLLNNKWREDMSRRRLIDYRNAEVPGDINDPEAWKKAVEEARKMLANAIAENGGNNNPYTSEYIPLESLDQIQSGDYLMYGGHFPPNTRWRGTKSEETSPNFYAQVVSVKTDENGNRVFEIKEPNRAQGGYYDNVFVNDEEFLDKFGGITGLARYSDENSNVKPAAEPVAEAQVKEEPKELTEEERQANRDAWTEAGKLYREYKAASRAKNKKREAKRLRQELEQFPVVVLHEKLTELRDILDNTRNSSTDENERKAASKRSAEVTDAMKQLNTLTNEGMKEGSVKPTDPLKFNFDDLFKEVEVQDGISESDIEEAAEEPAVIEEPAAEPTEEPKKNVIETAGGVLDFDALSPMQLGKIKAHLDKKVRWNGEVMTYRELYSRFAIGRHKSQNLRDVDYVKGESVKSWGPIKYFLFVDENGSMIDVPKMVYDAFKPNSDDPKLDSDATAPVQEAKMAERQRKWDEEAKAKAEAEAAKPAEEKPEEPVKAEPEKPAATPATPVETPKDLGPTQITKDTGKQYLAEKVDVGWTLYGPDGYALGVVVKKDSLGRVVQFTVRGPNGKESTYNFNMLTKLYAFSPKDKKDIEKANKTKPAQTKPESKSKPSTEPEVKEEPEEQPGEELPDKISREDGYRLFEALKKVYDYLHRVKRTEDPDAAKKDANDKVNQLAKILNPEDIDDFIRYVDLETTFKKIMSSRDYLDNFEKYIDDYSSGKGAEVNPIHRGADGKIINKGDGLVVVDNDGNLKKIKLQIFKKPNPTALRDKTDFIEWGYNLEIDRDGTPRIVNINNSKESYTLDNVFHTQDESEIRRIISNRGKVSPEAPAVPEAVENAAYNGNLEDDLSAFKNNLENAIENFRNQPGSDKNVYKAAAKELYNELKKLNSLYEDSTTSGDDLEQIRNVYDDKIRDLGDVQSAKEKSNPSQNREGDQRNITQVTDQVSIAAIADALANGDINNVNSNEDPSDIFASKTNFGVSMFLKQVTAMRLLNYMPDAKFDDLLKASIEVDTHPLFREGGGLAIYYMDFNSGQASYSPLPGQRNPVWIYNALNADMSDIKEGTELLVTDANGSDSLSNVSIITVNKELLNSVLKTMGDTNSNSIVRFINDELFLRVHSSSSQEDVDDIKKIMISHLIHNWAISSNDRSLKSHALQSLAREIFAMDPNSTADWNFTGALTDDDLDRYRDRSYIPYEIKDLVDLNNYLKGLVDQEINDHRTVYAQFLHAMYNATQDLLKDQGIDGFVLYRGTTSKELTGTSQSLGSTGIFRSNVKQRPMSSWSTDIYQAGSFASRASGKDTIVMATVIPADKIISFSGSGFGSYDEREVVVLGGEIREAFAISHGYPGVVDQSLQNLKAEVVDQLANSRKVLDTDRASGQQVVQEQSKPSQNRENPINIDDNDGNSDWIKTVGWDLPINVDNFLKMFADREQLSNFMSKPTAEGMPEEMLRNLWPAADKYFDKIESAPKEEEPKYLPEPFDPRNPQIDLDEYYNYDYTRMPDGTPFNSEDQQQMDAVERRLKNILKGSDGYVNPSALKNIKNFRRTIYQQIIAKPNENSSTTRESILKQIEFSDKPAVEYYDEASGVTYTRYVDTFTDKYGRKYYLSTNIDKSSGRQTVIAYDAKNYENMALPEDYIRKDQPVLASGDVGALRSYIYEDPSKSEIQSALVSYNYQRRGLATAMVAALEKRLGIPVVHSEHLSTMGFAFSNSIDPGKPDLHNNEKSIKLQEDNAPSQNREGFFKRNKAKKEPFDPTDPTIDLEKYYNYDYTKLPDGTPFNVYQQQQMDILKDAIDNETDNFERKLRIDERRRIYQGYTAKPNLKSGTNLESIENQVGLLDENTSRMSYSGAGKPYADLSPEYKQSTQYIDEFTDKYGRQYWVVTKVVNGLGMSNVKIYDKSKNSVQDLQDNSEDRTPVSMLDVFNNKISMVYTSDRYLRRGLATAALYLARKRSGKEVQHSEMLTNFGRAFSLSIDPNPDLHRNDESKAALSNNQPSQNREGQYLPEPFDPNDSKIDMDTIYNYDYTQLPDGTPFNEQQQKIMDWENKNVEEAIASGDKSKISAAKISRRHEYNKFITVANPDSETNTETIANQITLGKSKPKKFTGFVRYTDNFTDKYGRKYVIFTDIRTNDVGDYSAITVVYDMKSMFLEKFFTPEGMENVDQFGTKSLQIATLKVSDDSRKDPNSPAYIGMVLTDDKYRRRGLATAMLYLARKHYSKPVNHSSTLTMYGKAFSNSVDAGKPEVHDSLESKQLQIDLLKEKGLPVEEPKLDGDEIDYGPNQNREGASEPSILNEYREVIPLNNSYRDKNDPNLDITEWTGEGVKIYGIGNGGNPLGYVRTEKLATMKGNLADMESSTSSIAHDLEDGTGYLEPVLVWYNPLTGKAFIAEGNHRVEAARIAGREYVPVVVGVSTVKFKNPTKMERAGGVGDAFLNKDGSLYNFENVKDGSLINPYHLFNDEDLLYPKTNSDSSNVSGLTDVLKIQSDLLDELMAEKKEPGPNDIAYWHDPDSFNANSPIGHMGHAPEKLKSITAKNISENMLSSAKDMLDAVHYAITLSETVRNRFSSITSDTLEIVKKAIQSRIDNLNENSIVLIIDVSDDSPYDGLRLETLGEILDNLDPNEEGAYGDKYDNESIDYKALLNDYYDDWDRKTLFFDNPKDMEALKEKVASILVSQWAETSNGNDMVSHALQMAATEVFKMPDGSWAEWRFPKGQYGDQIKENAEYHYGIYGTVLKDFLKTMYDLTQDRFKNYGIKYLTLYRGTGVDEEALKMNIDVERYGVGDIEVLQRPMSSWSWLTGSAFQFATSGIKHRAGMFMGTIIPVDQVLSIPGTGFGCFEEAEIVLLAGKNRLVRAVISDDSHKVLDQKTFIAENVDKILSYLSDELLKDKNAFDNLIEFNKSTPGNTGPSQNREIPSINVDDSVENSDWVISEFAKKKKLDAKENELPGGSGQTNSVEEPVSLNELHRTFITALLSGAGDQRTRPLPDAKPEWLAADVETDNLTMAEKNAIYRWYMNVVKGDGASSEDLSINAQEYLVKHIIPLIDRHDEEHMLLSHHDIYINKDNNVTIKVVRFITNPTKKNGKTNVNTEYRAATAAGVAKFANKLSDVLSRVKFKFPVKELQVIVTHPNIEDFFKPFTRDDGTRGRNLAGLSFPHLFVNGQILNEEDNEPNPKLTENPRVDATELESTIAHEIGHVLEQRGIINFSDQATKDTLRRFMTEYPLSDYAATDEGEYLAEAYAGMMLSEDGIGRYKEVADWINNQIDTVDERKEKAAIDLLKTMLDKLGIPNNSKPSQNRENSREQVIASAAKDIASSGIGFIPGKVKNDISIATDGPVINIEGSPKKDAVAPSDQATAIKNEIIDLGHMILDDARAISDEQARSEGLIPEGFTAEEYRKKLKNDARTAELNILIAESKFKAMSQDLMRNAFNRLSYEDKEEVFQSFKKENSKNSILSGKDKNTFDAEETFNMLLVEYGDDLSHKLAYDYSTPYPEFTFDTGKTVLQRTRNRSGKLTKEVEERKTLVDVTWAHEGPDTILSMLTKWAIQTGKIDMSDFAQKAAEIKELRDRLRTSPKAEDFVEKYHSIIGKNIKSQMEKAGVEFDSVPAHQFFNQYKDYKYVNVNEKFQDIRIDMNKNLIKNLEETLSFIPKDIILAGMEYLASTGGKLGVQISDARARFTQHWKNKNLINSLRWKKEQGDGGFFRGKSTDDYLHEVWHFFQMINHDIAALEHAFSYDRIKASDNNNIIPSMELYGNWVEESFSGAKVADPYTVKVYPRSTSKFATFSPHNHSAEVITTTMQDLFTSPGSFSTPKGVTVKTGKGKNTTLFSDAHMDIATGIWYTDATMTTKIDPKLITGIEGMDHSNNTDWDLKAFGIGLLMSLLNWENK